MALYPTTYALILSPLINFMVICFTFRNEISEYDYNYIVKNKWFLRHTYYTFLFAVAGQAFGNILIMNIIGIKGPDISFAYHMIAAPIMSVCFSSVNEEIIYRLIIFGWLDKKYGFWIGSTVSSLIFMFSHYNYSGWFGYFLVGFAWCASYKRTGNIGINIVTHFIINLIFFTKLSF